VIGTAPENNEMKRTKRGAKGASPLFSVFAGPEWSGSTIFA
jgi:hypothetical protein